MQINKPPSLRPGSRAEVTAHENPQTAVLRERAYDTLKQVGGLTHHSPSREQVEIISKFYQQDGLRALDSCYDEVSADIRNGKISASEHDSALGMRLRGKVFENLALLSFAESERPYPELEEIILRTLQHPQLWNDFVENSKYLFEEDSELLDEFERIKPTPDEIRGLRCNDAIAITIENDEATGKRRAKITGVVECKNHQPTADGRDHDQYVHAPEALEQTVRRFGKFMPLLLRGLDPSLIPDEIDIVKREELNYAIYVPADVSPNQYVKESYPNCEFVQIPFTRAEIAALAEILKDQIPHPGK